MMLKVCLIKFHLLTLTFQCVCQLSVQNYTKAISRTILWKNDKFGVYVIGLLTWFQCFTLTQICNMFRLISLFAASTAEEKEMTDSQVKMYKKIK